MAVEQVNSIHIWFTILAGETSSTLSSKKFRRDVQGLRGIAIIYVLLFHLSPTLLPHGFLGVDIFFVISGYLITMILTRQPQLSSDSIKSFFSRRIQRIFPAYFLMISLVLIFGYFYLTHDDYRFLVVDAKWALGFASNIHKYLQNSDYFAEIGNYDFLLHAWSLAVEIQFYCIAPLIIAIFNEGIIGKWICITAAIFSAFYGFVKVGPMGFSSLQCRIWQFLVGGAAHLWNKRMEAKKMENENNDVDLCDLSKVQDAITYDNKLVTLSSILSVHHLILFFAVILISPVILFLPLSDNWCRILVTLGSAIVVALQHPKANTLFGNSVLYFIGNISYSLYLAHWPIIVFMKYDENLKFLSFKDASLALEYSIIIAFLSYRIVEKYFINKNFYRTILFVTIVATISIYMINVAASSVFISKIMTATIKTTTSKSIYNKSLSEAHQTSIQVPSFDSYVISQTAINMEPAIVASKTRFERFCYEFHDLSHVPLNFTETVRFKAITVNRILQKNPPNTYPESKKDLLINKYFYLTGAHLDLGGYFTNNGSTTVAILGNSYAHRALPYIRSAFGERFKEIRLISNTGCVPFFGSTYPEESPPGTCKEWLLRSLELVKEMQPDVVFFVFRPFTPFDSKITDIRTDQIMINMQNTIDQISAATKHIVLEMPLPLDPNKFQNQIINKALQRREPLDNIKLDYSFVWNRHQFIIRRMEYIRCTKCTYIYPHKIFCDSKICRVFDPDNLYSFFDDKTHYSQHAFKCIGKLYKDTIDEMNARKYM